MPTARTDFGAAVVDDLLYVVGGWCDGEVSSLNEQYVPIGYGSLSTPPEPSYSLITSEPEPSAPSLAYFIVAALAITIGLVVVSLVFYFKKRNRTCDAV
jgi:hypothetical protein